MNAKFGIVAKMVALAFVLVAVAATGVGLFSFYGFRHEIINQNIKLQGEEINIEAEIKKKELEELIRDTRFLSNTPPVQGIARAIKNNGIDPYDRSTKEAWIERLEKIFKKFLVAKQDYMKIDLIHLAEEESELLSVRKADGKIFRLSNNYQYKSHLLNISEVLKLSTGKVSISKIGLVKDGGNVVVPHIPMIRASTPVYDEEGVFFGAMIVSMDLRPLFDEISMSEAETIHTNFITNETGDYVYHSNPDKRFGFEFGRSYRIQDDFPEFRPVVESVKSAKSGQKIVSLNNEKMIMAYKKVRLDAMVDDTFILMVDAKP